MADFREVSLNWTGRLWREKEPALHTTQGKQGRPSPSLRTSRRYEISGALATILRHSLSKSPRAHFLVLDDRATFSQLRIARNKPSRSRGPNAARSLRDREFAGRLALALLSAA